MKNKKRVTPEQRNHNANLILYMRENLLPIEVVTPTNFKEEHQKQYLESLGFKIIKKIGNSFKVIFPDGWYYEKASNNWIYIRDDKDRRRMVIYFRAFLDKKLPNKVFMNYLPRYRVKIDHKIPYDPFKGDKVSAEHYDSPLIGQVVDSNGNVLYTYPTEFPMVHSWKDNRSLWSKRNKEARDKLLKVCTKWLEKHYPDYNNITTYWEDEKQNN